MCKYCEMSKTDGNNKSLMNKSLKNAVEVDLRINLIEKKLMLWCDNLKQYESLWLGHTDDYLFVKINYCPMCGKKVKKYEIQ